MGAVMSYSEEGEPRHEAPHSIEREEALWSEVVYLRMRLRDSERSNEMLKELVELQREKLKLSPIFRPQRTIAARELPPPHVDEPKKKGWGPRAAPIDTARLARGLCQNPACENPARVVGGKYCSRGCCLRHRWKYHQDQQKGLTHAHVTESAH